MYGNSLGTCDRGFTGSAVIKINIYYLKVARDSAINIQVFSI